VLELQFVEVDDSCIDQARRVQLRTETYDGISTHSEAWVKSRGVLKFIFWNASVHIAQARPDSPSRVLKDWGGIRIRV